LDRFYPFVTNFLKPHQRDVTKMLLYTAQASHPLVPPEDLQPVLRAIADRFIADCNSVDVMAVGLNAVREICSRCPLAIDQDLLQDLVEYKKHRSKTVMMAARSLICVYRHSNPELLHKRDRGRPTEDTGEREIQRYGEQTAKDFIPGADYLLKFDEEDQDQEEWTSASEDEDDDGEEGWIDVAHSSDEEEIKEEITPEEMENKIKQSQEISSSRIFTQEDFRRLNDMKLAKQAGIKTDKKPSKASRKRKRQADEAQDREGLPGLDAIENVNKKRAHDRDSRLSTIMEGREGRGKYSFGPQRMNPNASTTNKEKLKKKTFMMIKHKPQLKSKQKRSFKERKDTLRKSLLKQRKRH